MSTLFSGFSSITDNRWVQAAALGLGLGLSEGGCGSSNSAVDSSLPDYPARDAGMDRYVPPPPPEIDSDIRTNAAPLLNPIPDQVVNEGELLEIRLVARDPDGDRILYRVEPLPTGAVLDSFSGVFRWTPSQRQAGRYTVRFIVADDRRLETSQFVNITVNNTILTDIDGDNYREDVDCNDNDATAHPVPQFSRVMVTSNLTICPGTYRGVNLVVMADSITINATGAILEGVMGTMGEAIQIRDRHGVTIQGVTVRNRDYYSWGIGIYTSRNITVERYNFVGYFNALFLASSSSCRVTGGQLTEGMAPPPRYPSHGSMTLLYSQDNTIEGVTFGQGHYLNLDGSGSNSLPNAIISNNFTGGFTSGVRARIILHGGSDTNILRENRIIGEGMGIGIFIGGLIGAGDRGGSRNIVEGGTFERNETAIDIRNGIGNRVEGHAVFRRNNTAIDIQAGENQISNNIFEENGMAINVLGYENVIFNNQVTRSSGNIAVWARIRANRVVMNYIFNNMNYGLVSEAEIGSPLNPNVIMGNNLTANRRGNSLSCRVNICSDNREE